MTTGIRTVGAAAMLTASAWTFSSVLAAGRGLDLTDEGFYLVTYRWWDTYVPRITGSQYLFGPLFDLVEHRIERLRLLRLALHAAASAHFAVALITWAIARTSVSWSRADRFLLGLAVFAAGSSAYAWLPQSPGYNDVTIVTVLVLSAAVCHTAASSRLAVFSIFLSGAVLAAAVVARWSILLTGVVFLVIVLGITCRRRWRAAAVGTCAFGGGALLALTCVHAITPLPDLVSALHSSNRQLGGTSHAPVPLVVNYLASAMLPAVVGAVIGGVLACAWLIATGRGHRAAVPGLVAVVVAAPFLTYAVAGIPMGGHHQLPLMVCLWAYFMFAALTVLRLDKRPQLRPTFKMSDDALVAGWLLVAPWTHGLGTNNDLYFLALSCVGPWIGLLIYVWARLQAAANSQAAGVVAAALVGSILLSGWAAVTANLVAPYRSDPIWRTTEPADRIPALAGLRLSKSDVEAYDELERAVAVDGSSRLVILDDLPGLALVLGVPPLADAWTSAADPDRTWAGVEAVCREEPARPVVALTRSVQGGDLKALRTCGIDFYADYRRVRDHRFSPGIVIYVPRNR